MLTPCKFTALKTTPTYDLVLFFCIFRTIKNNTLLLNKIRRERGEEKVLSPVIKYLISRLIG